MSSYSHEPPKILSTPGKDAAAAEMSLKPQKIFTEGEQNASALNRREGLIKGIAIWNASQPVPSEETSDDEDSPERLGADVAPSQSVDGQASAENPNSLMKISSQNVQAMSLAQDAAYDHNYVATPETLQKFEDSVGGVVPGN